MILSPDKASIFADEFIDYFSNTGRIDEYLVKVKLDRLSKLPSALPGMGPEEDLFTKFDMHPSDMKIKVKPVQGKACLLYTSPSPRDSCASRMPSSA